KEVPVAGQPSDSDKTTIPFRDRLGCSPSEACLALGIGRTLLYDLIADGRIEVKKLRRRTIVAVPSLLKLVDAQAAEPNPRRPGRPRKRPANGAAPCLPQRTPLRRSARTRGRMSAVCWPVTPSSSATPRPAGTTPFAPSAQRCEAGNTRTARCSASP